MRPNPTEPNQVGKGGFGCVRGRSGGVGRVWLGSVRYGWVRSGLCGFGRVLVGSCGFVWAQMGSIGFFGDDGALSLTFRIFSAVDFKNTEFRQYLEDLLVSMSFYFQLYNPSYTIYKRQ